MSRTVRLTGTWYRANTQRATVSAINRQINGYFGREYGLSGKITTRRAAPAPGALEGSFDLHVVVPYRSNYDRPGRRASAEKRAKQLVAWYMSDMICRPPKLEYDE